MTYTNITCREQRVIDGSGRMTLGAFIATVDGADREFVWSDSPLDQADGAATRADAYSAAEAYISEGASNV